MIIGTVTLLTLLFFGGSNGQFEYLLLADGDKIFKEVIEDKNEQKAIFATLKPLRKNIAEYKASVESSLKTVTSMSMEYEDKTADIQKEFEQILKDFKAAETEITEARFSIAAMISEEDWALLNQRTAEEVEYREVPDVETSVLGNLDLLEESIEENILDEERKKRIFEAVITFRESLTQTIEHLAKMSPSSNEVFRNQKAKKLDIEKAYYPLNKSLTDTFKDCGFLYSKARSMSMQTEWDTMISAYKTKAKKK